MKSTAHSLFATACLFAASIHQSHAADTSTDLFDRVSTIISDFESDGADVEYTRIGFVSSTGKFDNCVDLEKGEKYLITLVGDEARLKDVDLLISDDEGHEVTKDETDANHIEVKLTPGYSCTFTFSISAGQLRKNCDEGMYALVIARACDSTEVSRTKAMRKQLSQWMEKSSSENLDLRSCSISCIPRTGSTSGIFFSADYEYTLVALGDGEALLDLDLCILDKNGKVVAADETDSNTALVKFSPSTSGNHSVKWKASQMKKGASLAHFGYIVICTPKAAAKTAAN